MKRLTNLVAAASVAFVLSACGGGGGDSGTTVAAANTTATINATTGATFVQGLSAVPLSFSTGVADFGTTTPTTVQLTAGATPSFSVSAGGSQASGELGFGSCIFKITTSTFPASHPLGAGKTITVSPCAISIATANQAATGTPVDTPVSLVLGTSKSEEKKIPITITSSGSVVITNPVSGTTVTLGTVSVTTVTGAS